MRGYLRQRAPGTWSFTVPAGYDPVTGKARQRYKTFRGSKREAEREMARFVSEVDTGQAVDAGRIRSAAYLETWTAHVRTRVRPRTTERYVQILRLHVTPVIGFVPLAKLRPAHVQQVVDAALAKDLTAQTVVHIYRVLHAALGQAVR